MGQRAIDTAFAEVPDDTAHRAELMLPSSSVYVAVGDNFSALFADAGLSRALPTGNGGLSGEQLLLLSAFQCAEGLDDLGAVSALGARVDFKYALHLPLEHPEVSEPALRRLRRVLRTDPGAQATATRALRGLVLLGFPWPAEMDEATTGRLLDEVSQINALSLTSATLWLALQAVSESAAAWLWDEVLPGRWAWYADRDWARTVPADGATRTWLARQFGEDARQLLEAVQRPDAPASARQVTELELLGTVWRWQYRAGSTGVAWRLDGSGPPEDRRRAAAL